MKHFGFYLFLCVCTLSIAAPTPVIGQRRSTQPVSAVQHRAAAQRFLADRGLLTRHNHAAPSKRLPDPAHALAQARVARRSAYPASAQAAPYNLTAAWMPLGPSQTVTPTYGPVTGRVTSIAIDPSDASGNTVFAGTTGGGVWKSSNAAGTAAAVVFAPLTDQAPSSSAGLGSLSIGAVTVQPGGTGVVLAGTGDPNDALDSYYGQGVLRSADHGVTWSAIDEADKYAGSPPHSFIGNGFAGFAWGPSNVVVAAVTQALDGIIVNAQQPNSVEGLYYSTDAGVSWQMATIKDGPSVVQSSTLSAGGGGNAATAVVWNPFRKMFYAAIRYHGYYGSPDGVTWTRLAHQPGAGLTTINCPANPGGTGNALSCPILRGALTVQPITGDMFAITVGPGNVLAQGNPDQGIWWDLCGSTCTAGSSANFGTQIADLPLDNGSGSIAQGDYDLWLAAVAAGNGSTDTLLYAGTEDIFKYSLATGQWRNTTNVNTCAAANVAASQHAVSPGPIPGLLYFGNDSGLWRTRDGIAQQAAPCSNDDAAHFDNLNTGIGSLAEVTSIAGAMDTIMIAEGANGTAATANAPANGAWPQVLDGFGAYTAIDPADPQNWYSSSYGVSIYQCPDGNQCAAALFPYTPVIGDAQTANDGDALANPAVWMLDPQDSTKVIVGTCRIWRGSILAPGWTAGNALSGMLDGDNAPACQGNAQVHSLGASGTLTTPAYGPGTTQEILYAGMDGEGMDGLESFGQTAAGHAYTASFDAAASGISVWTDLFPSHVVNDFVNGGQFNPGGFAVSSIVADTHDSSGQTVYATIQGFSGNGLSVPTVYRSTNQGALWANETANLPAVPVNGLVVDPDNAGIVYVATDAGVYVTTTIATCNSGQSQCWSYFGTGMPDVPVTTIAASGPGGLLRAGTYGRGVWQVPLVSANAAQTSVALLPAAGVLAFGGQQVQTQSAVQTVTITNTGTSPLIVTGPAQIATDALGQVDFNETDNCASAIQPNGTCTLTVGFDPTVTGPLTAVLTLTANVTGGQITVSLSGTGSPAGPVTITPQTWTFPPTALGATSAVKYFAIANTGATVAALKSPLVSGPFQIASNDCGASEMPATACTLGIVFSPSIRGLDSGVFTIVAVTASGTDALEVQLAGNGLAPPTDALSTTSMQFPLTLVGIRSAPQQVVIQNTGDEPLTSVVAASSSPEFLVTTNCATISANTNCAVSVSFVPALPGVRSASLTIGDLLHVQTVAMTGTGVASAGVPSVEPSSTDFGGEGMVGLAGSVPSTLETKSQVLTNNGSTAMTGLQFTATGDFQASPGNCGTTLAPGAACTASVMFLPAATGVRTGTFTASWAGEGSGLSSALTGVGLNFSMQLASAASVTVVSGTNASYQVSLLPIGASTGSLSLTCTGAPAGSTCTANPSTVQLTTGQGGFAVVTVVTPAVTAAAVPPPRSQGGLWVFGGVSLAFTLPLWPRRRWMLPLAAMLLVIATGCGLTTKSSGGGGTGGGSGGGGTGTNYTLTLTAAAPGIQESIPMTLVLEQ